MIGQTVAPQRRDYAERDTDERREQHRVERELSRRRDELPEVLRDRLVRER